MIEHRFGTATALAGKVGMKLSPFTRGVRAGKLNLVNLLTLARVAEEQPSKVLRLAGKHREADIIEQAYGPQKPVTDPVLQDLLELWPTFTADEKTYVRSNVRMLLLARSSAHAAQSENARDTRPAKSSPPRPRQRRETAASAGAPPLRRMISFDDGETDARSPRAVAKKGR